MVRIDPILARRLYRLSLACAATAAATALLVLIGWYGSIPRLTYLITGLATMKVNTAVALLLCSTAMVLRIQLHHHHTTSRLADVAAIIAMAIAAITLAEYALGRSLGIDRLLYNDTAIPAHGHPGRMSIATAISILSVSTGVLLLDRATRVSQGFVIFGLLIVILGLLGFMYGTASLYNMFAFSSMAIHTAIALCLISAAHLTARPRRCLHHLLVSNTTGGRLTRRVLPATIVVPLIVGWIRLKGQQWGYYDTEFGLAIFALSNIVILAGIVWWNALLLDRSETDRLRIEADRDSVLIREQLARARAEKALLARDQLLAVVSHELRTPLTPALLTATALAHRVNLPMDVQEDLQLIREQIEIEARLIDDLLDMASLKQGKLTLNKELVDLHDLLRTTVERLARPLAEQQISLSLELEGKSPRLMGDPVRLRQVMVNLFGNAIKFTPPGGQVRLRTYDLADGIALETIDTGAGFDSDTLARIFEAFEQGDPSTTRRFGGLGVGLAISRLLVQLHGGTLVAASNGIDRGATFTVSLPHNLEPAVATPETAKPSILLVDDNEQTLWALERLLRSRGYEVVTATSAKRAMELAEEGKYALLISDIGLPDMSGWELMRQLRDVSPIRGIAVSGFIGSDDRAKSLECGFSAHLTKPLSIQDLMAAIQTVNSTAGKTSRVVGSATEE